MNDGKRTFFCFVDGFYLCILCNRLFVFGLNLEAASAQQSLLMLNANWNTEGSKKLRWQHLPGRVA